MSQKEGPTAVSVESSTNSSKSWLEAQQERKKSLENSIVESIRYLHEHRHLSYREIEREVGISSGRLVELRKKIKMPKEKFLIANLERLNKLVFLLKGQKANEGEVGHSSSPNSQINSECEKKYGSS
jgi:hypothetical protein